MHLVFDLDGTLVDSLPGIASAMNLALAQNNLPQHSQEAIRTFIGDGSFMLCKRASGATEDAYIHELDRQFQTLYQDTWRDGTVPFEGITSLLETVQSKHTLSILSNKTHRYTEQIAKQLFADTPFTHIIGFRPPAAVKPAPTTLKLILEKSSNGIMIGDSTVDVQVGKNANCGTIACTWGYHTRAALLATSPDHCFDSVQALHQHLQSLD